MILPLRNFSGFVESADLISEFCVLICIDIEKAFIKEIGKTEFLYSRSERLQNIEICFCFWWVELYCTRSKVDQ